MLKEYKFAHSRYQIHMEVKKKESVEAEREKKRKAKGEELKKAERKKNKLESVLADLHQLAFDAEKKNKISLLVKSYALRSKAKEKQ